MKRDVFKRGTRMTHKFGETEDINDPVQRNTFPFFEDQKCVRPERLSEFGHSCEVQDYGEHEMFNPARSPVQKPNGQFASNNGPAPDMAEGIAAPIPFSTKKRKDHLKTDK